MSLRAPTSAPTSEPFGATPDGRPVERWRLESPAGVGAEILTYGAILHALHVPGRGGRRRSVVLSLPDPLAYAAGGGYLGAVVGRYANRIAGGRFILDGATHQLPVNDRGQTLHGGPDGFHARLWTARPLPGGALRLSLASPDGDMGFPGALEVSVTYALAADGTLSLDFTARADRATVVNLTSHAYFNLGGAGSGDVLGHTLRVDADRFLPVTAVSVPSGPPLEVAGTPFDFTLARPLGAGVRHGDPQIKAAGGYDHCWVLRAAQSVPSAGGGAADGRAGEAATGARAAGVAGAGAGSGASAGAGAGAPAARTAAVLHDPVSGRTMQVRTTEPGVQVYTANNLDGSLADADGHRHVRHGAVCLETQHLPDSPNRPDFPSTVLRPGEALRSRTEFAFPHLRGAAGGGTGAAAAVAVAGQ